MSSDQSTPDFDGLELRRLISAWCDSVIEPSDCSRLHSLLAESQMARRMYLEYIEIHSGVQGEVAAREYLESFVPPPHVPDTSMANPHPSPPVLKSQVWSNWTAWMARPAVWAALILIGVATWKFVSVRQSASMPNLLASSIHPAVLARVIDQSPDCQWHLDRGADSLNLPGELLHSGETIRIGGGTMSLSYTNGTRVTLYGPALYQVVSDTQARVLLGKVTADIAEGAKGFSILTPRATVVDLGTQFGINVTDVGSTDVVVFKGTVDVNFASADDSSSRQRRLRTGEAVHLDAQGTESRIISISNDWFSDRPGVDPAHPPAIIAVRDNISAMLGTITKLFTRA